MLSKARKSFVANLLEQFGLVFEIKVDRGGRILDLVRDAAHGDVFVAFLDEEFAGRVEDFLAEKFFLAKFAFFDAHN